MHALAVSGSFDQAQAVLKQLFGDGDFRARNRLSAVNSINIARILAQSVYYLHAWLGFPRRKRRSATFVVPTGARKRAPGWMLQRMGVPIRGFRVATNQNDLLHRLFTSGEYRVGKVCPSLAPSMDIQVASNFERFLYYSLGRDPERVRSVMGEIARTGAYSFRDFDRDTFTSSRCDDSEIPGIIQRVHRDHGYILDPHTACAFKQVGGEGPRVVLATASPAKFPEVILDAIGVEPTHPSLQALKSRPLARHKIVADAAPIRAFIESHAV